ncbi:MAG: WecB/TagA/CpsF family glycosyltransferase [Symbiobacteriia bacterium]
MKDEGKQNVLGVLIDAVDYEAAVRRITLAAKQGRGYAVSALAVHGVMTGVGDSVHRHRLNHFDLAVPDGQPVRWALNLLYRTGLSDRVYGPRLMLELCAAAEAQGLPIYLYGSRVETLEPLAGRLRQAFPALIIAGFEPSKFRRTTPAEKGQIVSRIRGSGAKLVFVGLGCPRQEVFAYEYRDELGMPLIAVGAAFDYHAGLSTEPPGWIQRAGLQWLMRLFQHPARLWRRYILLNPAYLGLLAMQRLHLFVPDPAATVAPAEELRYG